MELLQFADSIEGFAEVEEEISIDESDADLKAEIEALRTELRDLRREAKQAGTYVFVFNCIVNGTNFSRQLRKTSSYRSSDFIAVNTMNMLITWPWSRSTKTLLD